MVCRWKGKMKEGIEKRRKRKEKRKEGYKEIEKKRKT
jgi:hypothetical protein